MIHLDTHVVVWVYVQDRARIDAAVERLLRSDTLAVSPVVRLELGLLHEIGRLLDPPDTVLDRVLAGLDASTSAASFPAVCSAAVALTWTRDPFDRLIAATALVDGARLLTRDRRLQEHLPSAVWP